MSAIAFCGKSGFRPMQPNNDVQLAGSVRQHVLTAAGQTSLDGDRRNKLILTQVKNRWPTAVDSFGKDAIVALLHRPRTGVPGARSGPSLLQQGVCGSCSGACALAVRADAAPIAEREDKHVAALVAAGFKPEASANLRSPEQIADYRRRLDALDAAKLPPRSPTGAIWAANRKTPALSYYQPAVAVTVTRSALPWARLIVGDCGCSREAPCLYHFDQALDWRKRKAALARVGIQPATGR